MNTPLRKWALALILVGATFGVFVGGLLTWHHDVQLYGGEQAELIGCVESATVNCDVVNTSAWSEIAGIPLGTLAIPAYLLVGTLAALGLRGRREVLTPLAVAGGVAVIASAFLFYISKVELGVVCAWCLRLYATNAAIAVLAFVAGKPDGKFDPAIIRIGAAVFLGTLVLSAGAERVWRGTLVGDAPSMATGSVAKLAGDPSGPAPELRFDVTTEDGKQASFRLDPDDAWKGPRDAKIAVVEFADLQCGYCKRANSEMNRLYEAYGDRVLFVWKHFPMNPDCNPGVKNKKHRDACRAAAAATCAGKQGKFWEYTNLAFKNQHQLGDAYLSSYAKNLGLDTTAFDACVRSPTAMAEVRHDAEVGGSLDIHGTPRIFIDGKLYRSGTSAEAMARAIEAALGSSASESRAAMLRESAGTTPAIPEDVPAMRSIEAGGLKFQIDTFEAAILAGKASSGKHLVPATRTSWHEAAASCAAAGKRLCTEEEWVTACQGARAIDENGNGEFADDMIEGTAYPYGDFHEKGRCWEDHEVDPQSADPWRPVYTGEMPACVTPSGVYDMTGNVEEWVGATPETAVLLGGAFDTSEDHARCYRRNDTFGAGYASLRTGFRCCTAAP
jgi:protein-disulfide isomerase/uncharacterized membrane protein